MKKLFFAILLLLVATAGWGATLYIDGTSGACAGNYSIANRTCTGTDGSSYAAFNTAAAAASAGDTIYWRAGTYAQTEKTFQGKRLLVYRYPSDPVGSVIINPSASNNGFYLQNSGVSNSVLSGLVISGGGGAVNNAAVTLDNVSDVTVSDITVTGYTGYIVRTVIGGSNTISKMMAYNNTKGIVLAASTSLAINYSQFYENGDGTSYVIGPTGIVTGANTIVAGGRITGGEGLIKSVADAYVLNNWMLLNTGKDNRAAPTYATYQTDPGTITCNNCIINGAMVDSWNFLTYGSPTLNNCLTNTNPKFATNGVNDAIFTFFFVDSNHIGNGSMAQYQAAATAAGVHITYFPDDQDEWTAEQITAMQSFVAAGHDLGVEGISSSRLDMAAPFSISYSGAGANPRVVITHTADDNTSLALVTDSGTDNTLEIGKGQTYQYIGTSVTQAGSVAKTIHDLADWAVTMLDDGSTSSFDDTYAYTLAADTVNISGATPIPFDNALLLAEEVTNSKALTETAIGGYTVVSYMYPRYYSSTTARTVIAAGGFTSALSTLGTTATSLSSIADMYSLSIYHHPDFDLVRGPDYAGLTDAQKEARIRGWAKTWATAAIRYGYWMAMLLPEAGAVTGDELTWLASELVSNGVRVKSFAEAAAYVASTSSCDDGACTRTMAQTYSGALSSSSPAINAGTDVSLTTDYAGNLVPRGSAPDIGAYEYQGGLNRIPNFLNFPSFPNFAQ